MYLYIARHAWAGHFGDAGWADDSLRELEPAGARRYVAVVEALAERGFAPEIIATSPYVRCRQTADIIAAHTPADPELHELNPLRPGSDFDALAEWTRELGDDRSVCWVGHAPDVGRMTATLIGAPGGAIRFSKGGVAAVRLYDAAGPGAGELYWHATAKLLGL